MRIITKYKVSLILFTVILFLCFLIPYSGSAGGTQYPTLREWQAKRVTYGYTIGQSRPEFVVVRTKRISKYRVEVHGEEAGYLGLLEGPDVTVTLVERRGFQFWVKDPFTSAWVRWL